MPRRLVISDLDGLFTELSRPDQAFPARFRILHNPEFLRQLPVELTVEVTEKFPAGNFNTICFADVPLSGGSLNMFTFVDLKSS